MTERTTGGAGTSRGASVRDAATEAGKQAKAMAGDMSAAAREKGEELKERAGEAAREKTSQAANMMGALANALHAASRSLREQQQDKLGRVGDDLAEEVDRFAARLERSDTSGLLDEFEQFGRRNPTTFLVTAFVGGLLAGRFLRSSSPDQHTDQAGTSATDLVETETVRPPPVYREPGTAADINVSTSGGAND